MRGKLPHDYTTQGSIFKAKKRDGDQTDIKGFRATVPAEEFMPEQQWAVAADSPSRLHLCPRPLPAHASEGEPQMGATAAELVPSLPVSGMTGTPCLPVESTGQGVFHHCTPFSQNDLPVEGTEQSLRCALCNLYVNEAKNMQKRAADTLLQWIPPSRIWFLSEAYTDGVSAD